MINVIAAPRIAAPNDLLNLDKIIPIGVKNNPIIFNVIFIFIIFTLLKIGNIIFKTFVRDKNKIAHNIGIYGIHRVFSRHFVFLNLVETCKAESLNRC